MARNQHLIDGILDSKEEPVDKSLRGQALLRATAGDTPRTLTAWEWEEYYKKHGKPHGHAPARKGIISSILQRFLTRWRGRR